MQNTGLIEKIQNLPPDIARQVEIYIDSLADQKSTANGMESGANKTGDVNLRELGISAEAAAEQRAAFASFAEDWEHPAMDVYDKL